MKQVKTIAYFTFKELISSRILLNVAILGLFLMLLTYVASEFTFGAAERIAIDFGLGALTISSIGIAIFLGVSLISKEIETRTIYMLISRPVTRSQVLIGKYLGFSAVLFSNILILTVATLSIFTLLGGELSNLIVWSLVYVFIESIMVLLIVVTLSMLTNNVIAVIATLSTYVVGQALDPNSTSTLFLQNPFMQQILKVYHFLLPGFYKLNIKDFVLYKQDLEFSFLLSTLGYGVTYCLFLGFISLYIIEKKDIT